MQNRHAAFRPEFRLARVAGIEIQHAVNRLTESLVRVAEHHRVRPLARDPQPEFPGQRARIHDVMNQKFASGQLHDLREPEGR